MTHVACRLTAKNRDQHRNPTLGNRVWATIEKSVYEMILNILNLEPCTLPVIAAVNRTESTEAECALLVLFYIPHLIFRIQQLYIYILVSKTIYKVL